MSSNLPHLQWRVRRVQVPSQAQALHSGNTVRLASASADSRTILPPIADDVLSLSSFTLHPVKNHLVVIQLQQYDVHLFKQILRRAISKVQVFVDTNCQILARNVCKYKVC